MKFFCFKFERVKREIDEILGSRTFVNFDDLPKLEYTTCAINEVLRKYPPAASFTRFTTQETTLCGFKIPKDTWIEVYFNISKM